MFRKRSEPPANSRIRPQVERARPKTFSYHANREPNEQMDRRGRKRSTDLLFLFTPRLQPGASKTQQLLYGVGFIVVVAGLIYNTFLTVVPQTTVVGQPEDRLLLQNTSVYADAGHIALASSYLNHTKVTVQSKKVEAQLLKQFPELAAAQVALPLFGNTPKLQLVPAAPIAVFTASDAKTYVMDKAGRVVSADTGNAPTGIPIIIDQSGLRPSLGEQVLPEDDVIFLIRLQHQLREKRYEVTSYTLPAAGREVDVRLKAKPYYIKFSLEGNVLQQAGAFDAVASQLEKGKVIPGQYIDVRVGDRVYYK
jgi:hypothetical protein